MKTEEIKPIDVAKYIADEGASCPHCGSDDIEGDEVTIESCKAFQDMCCMECGAEWRDYYTLSGANPTRNPEDWRP